MALPLYIHPCICNPAHPHHPPPRDKPLRICIQGPLESITKSLPDVTWNTENFIYTFPQQAGPLLTDITYRQLYGYEEGEDIDVDLVVRDEYLAWVVEDRKPLDYIDYFGITLDFLVPPDELDPEVLAVNIIELDNDNGAFARECLPIENLDPKDYTGKQVLAVPRC